MMSFGEEHVCPGHASSLQVVVLTDFVKGPILLGSRTNSGVMQSKVQKVDIVLDWRELPRHKDEDQVKLDVNRSFVYYPHGQSELSSYIMLGLNPDPGESDGSLEKLKLDLSDVIVQSLRRHPMLCYFQGFHDIVQVLLLVLGKDLAIETVPYLSLLRIRDFMLPSLSPSLIHLQLLPSILYSVDSHLCNHLSQTQPFFALAATLTLYAHDIQEYSDIARLFDFLLAHEAAISIYFFAVIIISRKKELLDIPPDEPEMLHFTLSKLPKPLDLEHLIVRTVHLFRDYPPEGLPSGAWRKVSPFSVLKTTRALASAYHGTTAAQTLGQGETLFLQQAAQLRWYDLRRRLGASLWRYRAPASGIALAVLIGLCSIWLQKNKSNGVFDHFWAFPQWLRRIFVL